MKKLQQLQFVSSIVLLALAAALVSFALPAQAQTFNTLYTFQGENENDGSFGQGLTEGPNGSLYGTTFSGGQGDDLGTVFEISAAGQNYRILYTLNVLSTFGDGVQTSPLLATNGDFYVGTGSNPGGCEGNGSCGTIFRMTSSGNAKSIYNFCSDYQNGICLDGAGPAGLVQASNDLIYGATSGGGTYGHGVVYKVGLNGGYTVLHSFCAQVQNGYCTDGSADYSPLVEGPDGNLYGTTSNGGANEFGTFYRITPAGKFTSLYSFCAQANCVDGGYPGAEGTNSPGYGFALGNDGNFYGTTVTGGAAEAGTFYKMTPGGVLTVLYNFCSVNTPVDCADGAFGDQVILGSDGNFYGFTRQGGTNGYGTIFQITPAGVLTVVHNFDYADGLGLGARLTQNTNGKFYGTTFYSNTNVCDCGTIFELQTGLHAFVETLPNSGKVGLTVGILGSNLKGATSVTFNGTPATFTQVSNTVIKATVPAGATTGWVQVVTPQGTLTSNVVFTIP